MKNNVYQHHVLEKGLTLIEMVVVVGIVALVSAVIIFNYSGFRSNITLRGLSQEIALAVRKAQTYATSVQSIDGASGSTAAFPGYGISFSVTNGTSANPAVPSRQQFILFADIEGSSTADGMYNSGSSCGDPQEGSECVESFKINSTDRIVKLCTEDGCLQSSGTIDIVFNRPAPDATLCVVSGASCQSNHPSYVDVYIQAMSGKQRIITVWNTGQISVQ